MIGEGHVIDSQLFYLYTHAKEIFLTEPGELKHVSPEGSQESKTNVPERPDELDTKKKIHIMRGSKVEPT